MLSLLPRTWGHPLLDFISQLNTPEEFQRVGFVEQLVDIGEAQQVLRFSASFYLKLRTMVLESPGPADLLAAGVVQTCSDSPLKDVHLLFVRQNCVNRSSK